jgi:hypothetical protein
MVNKGMPAKNKPSINRIEKEKILPEQDFFASKQMKY